MKKFLKEFKEFATKGNVVDMAIGLVVGGAFKEIVTALVDCIISPLIGLMTGGTDLSDHKIILQEASTEIINGVETVVPENALMWGSFVQSILDFLIIAFSIFVVIKVATTAHRKAEEAKNLLLKKQIEEAKEEAKEPEPSSTDKLLIEIRDLLKEKENDK